MSPISAFQTLPSAKTYIDEMGLSREEVQAAIEAHLSSTASKIINGSPLNQIIEVSGKKILYTTFKPSDGTINIGRIHAAN